LKNLHHFPARGFALKADSKNNAIMCDSDLRRTFNDSWISDNYSANTDSGTLCDSRYMNDTRLDGDESFHVVGQFQSDGNWSVRNHNWKNGFPKLLLSVPPAFISCDDSKFLIAVSQIGSRAFVRRLTESRMTQNHSKVWRSVYINRDRPHRYQFTWNYFNRICEWMSLVLFPLFNSRPDSIEQ
jgi:hypothetical protein